MNGHTTVGGLSILMSYFMQLIKNITYYIQLGQKYQSIKASVHRIDEILGINKVLNGKNICKKIQYDKIQQKVTKLKEIRKNYCTGVKIMVSSRWSIYIYNVYRNKYD